MIIQSPVVVVRASNPARIYEPSVSAFENVRRDAILPSGLRTTIDQWPWTVIPSLAPCSCAFTETTLMLRTAAAMAAELTIITPFALHIMFPPLLSPRPAYMGAVGILSVADIYCIETDT
jgi:hypothetical protein